MNHQKRRFNSLDCFILILILVIGGAFIAKTQLANLFGANGEVEQVLFHFETEDASLIAQLQEGTELFTPKGISLGTVSALEKTSSDGKESLVCTALVYAGPTEEGFVISSDTVLASGRELSLRFGDQIFLVTVSAVSTV